MLDYVAAAPQARRLLTLIRKVDSMAWGPAHDAVELGDVALLRSLLDAGADVEGDVGDGWTLLRHAIDAEIDACDQVGASLHVDVTTLLISRGADPERKFNGVSALEEARGRGHWLAVELMESWLSRSTSRESI
jgi:ankyrin repeat protein